MTDQVGLLRFKLSQKQYDKGAFYLSVVRNEDRIEAIDGRYFIETGTELTPTKKGFRIPIDKLDSLRSVLGKDLRDIDDAVLFENNSFQFHIRYLNDKYGEGIDLRKYRTTKKFTGWDRSGIRMKLEDVTSLRDWFASFDPSTVADSGNIFSNKQFVGKKHKREVTDKSHRAELNSDIEEILNF